MDDYVLFDWAPARSSRSQRDFSQTFLQTIQSAVARTSPALDVRYGNDVALGTDIEIALRELITGATGAIVLLDNESVGLGVELGFIAQAGVPLLALEVRDKGLERLVRTSPNLTRIVIFDPGGNGYGSMEDVEGQIVDWMSHLARRATPASATTVTINELRALEAFSMAFYRAVFEGTTGLNERDLLSAQIHVDTINLQLRAPEPNRSVLKATIRALGTFLLGTATGVAGSYLYDLLPHLH